MSSPKRFGHPVQNLAPGCRVAAISPIGPERALLCRPGAGDVVAERRDERGVVAAEQAGRVWAALYAV